MFHAWLSRACPAPPLLVWCEAPGMLRGTIAPGDDASGAHTRGYTIKFSSKELLPILLKISLVELTRLHQKLLSPTASF